jgi:hypothetical protein
MKAGRTIRNNQTGGTLAMVASEEDNSGKRQLCKVFPPARPLVPALHCDVAFAKTFTVIDGALDFYLGRDREHILLKPHRNVTAQIEQAPALFPHKSHLTSLYERKQL